MESLVFYGLRGGDWRLRIVKLLAGCWGLVSELRVVGVMFGVGDLIGVWG